MYGYPPGLRALNSPVRGNFPRSEAPRGSFGRPLGSRLAAHARMRRLPPGAPTVTGVSAHAHDHEHRGHGHAHGVSADADTRKLAVALALILGFMLVEVIAGIAAGSLALLSDAGHMLTDAAAIALSLVAIRLAARPARGVMTYGLKRVEILSAQANGVTLLVLALLILFEGVRRLIDPPAVEGGLVLVVALVGVVVNLIATWVLAGRTARTSTSRAPTSTS